MRPSFRTAGWCCVLMAAGAAHVAAQEFTFTRLHPFGIAQNSAALAASENVQVGWVAEVGGLANQPALWRGGADSYVNLLPKGWQAGDVYGAWGDRQVGSVRYTTVVASVWRGSAESWQSIHPAGYRTSEAFGIHGSKVVGAVDTISSFEAQAGLWDLDTGEFTYLHPGLAVRARNSKASVTDGVVQAGRWQRIDGRSEVCACMWTGTRDSFVDLHPAAALGLASRRRRL